MVTATAVPDHRTAAKTVGTANLDWANLGFAWRDVNSHVKFVYKDGRWGQGELVKDSYVKVHIANTALHYGQAVFEGMKAFHCKDQSVKIFRPYENAARIKRSAERILMAVPPAELFVEGVKQVIRDNIEFVPPYGSDGALYIRPLLFGSGPRIGLQPSDEYTLLIMVMPVGNYYKGGMKPTTAVVIENYDRAAPKGVGGVKVAGNYAADMLPNVEAKQAGFPIGLYLDAKTNSYIEEFSTSNFLAVTKDNK
jgi:branched-chain amino acid aminotransferase